LGSKIVFEEVSKDQKLQSFVGLQNFVKLDFQGKPIYVFDNHNHALSFWGQSRIDQDFDSGVDLIHIDQHSDLNQPSKLPDFGLSDPDFINKIHTYTNTVANVGDFIVPSQAIALTGKCHQIRTEYGLLHFDIPDFDYILDIDLDFRAPGMSISNHKQTIQQAKKLIQKAKCITIATSPYFLDQKLAIKTLNELLNNTKLNT